MRKLGKIHLKILDCVKNSSNPLPPSVIARKIGENPSTTRVYVRDLLRWGKLFQPFPGHYSLHTTYGVGVEISPIKVHDLCLVADCGELKKGDKLEDVRFEVGSIRFHYVYGKKRGKFSCRVSYDEGLSFTELLFVLNRVDRDFYSRFLRRPEFLCSFHLNRDFGHIELTSIKTYTRTGLLGFFRRVYQKEDDLVRAEVGLNGLSVDDMVSLVMGDLNYFEFSKNVDIKLDSILDVMKRHSRIIFDYGLGLERLSSAFVSLFPEDPYQKPGSDLDDPNPLVS
jgi:hypothetical protein